MTRQMKKELARLEAALKNVTPKRKLPRATAFRRRLSPMVFSTFLVEENAIARPIDCAATTKNHETVKVTEDEDDTYPRWTPRQPRAMRNRQTF